MFSIGRTTLWFYRYIMSRLITINNYQFMKTTLESFIIHTAEGMRQRGQYSAAKTCLSVYRGLSGVAGNGTLSFADITPALLKAYEHQLITRERNPNTVSLYMRTLQNICNRARHKNVADVPEGIFDTVFTGTEPVQHRAVTPEVIHRINCAIFEGKDSRLNFARDMFMLSFFLRGIPFIDLAHLRKCDMKDGVITYRRRKTGRPARLLVEPCALKIINRYAPQAENTTYLLPVIRNQGTADNERRQYESALRLYNKHLNKISEKLGLGVHLSSYVARHSWATIAHDIGVDVADISAALCHSTEKMTRNYLQSFTPDRLANVNRRVLRTIMEYKTGEIGKNKRRKDRVPRKKFYSGSL